VAAQGIGAIEMNINDLNLPGEDRADLEAWGEHTAKYFEDDFIPTPSADVPPLVELRRVRYSRARLEKEAAQMVDAAHSQGASWYKIGLALGTTAEATRRRYRLVTN